MYYWQKTDLKEIVRYVRTSDEAIVAVVHCAQQHHEKPKPYEYRVMKTGKFSLPFTTQKAAMEACERQFNKTES